MPSAGHGAGVSGVPDSTLRCVRAVAAGLLGAKGHAHVTPYLCTHHDVAYDPVVDATVPIEVRYCCWVWDRRIPDSDLRRGWQAATDSFEGRPHWSRVRGPIGATMLSLRRIGWALIGPHHIRTDQGHVISLFTTSPSDVKALLVEGICRAQCVQLITSLPEASGSEIIWGRALRLGVQRIRDPSRKGAVRALLGGAL